MNASALCEICLPNNRACGVAAIGRCSRDGTAFCATHQGRDIRRLPVVDLCIKCTAADDKAFKDRQDAYKRRIADAVKRIETAAATLARSSFAPTARRQVTERIWHKQLFGRGHYEDVTEELPSAWPVGKYMWQMTEGFDTLLTGVTSDGQIVAMHDQGQISIVDHGIRTPMPHNGPIRLAHLDQAVLEIADAMESLVASYR